MKLRPFLALSCCFVLLSSTICFAQTTSPANELVLDESSATYSDDVLFDVFSHSQLNEVIPLEDENCYQFDFVTNYIPDDLKISEPELMRLSRANNIEIDTENINAQTTLSIITSDKNSKDLLENLSSADPSNRSWDNNYRETWDETYGIKAYTTVYFEEDSSSGVDTMRLIKVAGGVQQDDQTISIVYDTSNYMTIGCTDILNPFQVETSEVIWVPFLKFPPSEWVPIDNGQSISKAVGTYWHLPLSRGNRTWVVEQYNTIVNEGNVEWS